MIDFLGVPISIPTVGGWGMFALTCAGVVRAFIKGDLVSRSVLEDVRADRDARLAEVGAWKQAWEERGKVIDTLMEQNRELTALSEVSAHALSSLPAPQPKVGEEG